MGILCLFLGFIRFAQNVKLGIRASPLHSFATFVSSLVFLCIYSKQSVTCPVSLAIKTRQIIRHQYVCQHPETTKSTFLVGTTKASFQQSNSSPSWNEEHGEIWTWRLGSSTRRSQLCIMRLKNSFRRVGFTSPNCSHLKIKRLVDSNCVSSLLSQRTG